MTKRKRTNNDLQNTTQKTKDRVTQTPLKTGGELRCSGRVSSSCSTSDTRRVTAWAQKTCLTPPLPSQEIERSYICVRAFCLCFYVFSIVFWNCFRQHGISFLIITLSFSLVFYFHQFYLIIFVIEVTRSLYQIF